MFCRRDPVGFSETKDDVYSVEISDDTYNKLMMANRQGCILRSGEDGTPEAVSEFGNGSVVDLSAVTETSSFVPPVTLADQAKAALQQASSKTWAAYGMYGETPPEEWQTYLSTLKAIAKGTDTTSTALPAAPAS